jgi:hypothetical protein
MRISSSQKQLLVEYPFFVAIAAAFIFTVAEKERTKEDGKLIAHLS